MQESFETTEVEFDESTGVGYLTMNRPDALNALSGQLRRDIVAGLTALNDLNDDGIVMRAVVIDGAGGNFCAGADINEFSEGPPSTSVDRSHGQFIIDYPMPVIAKIRGYCLGGGLETAMACDFRIASEEATIGLPESNLGILPGAGGVQFIARLANASIAKEVAMTGDHYSAEQAAEWDILNHVYPDGDLDDEVDAFAAQLAGQPPLSIQRIKESANVANQTGLKEGREFDRKAFEPLLSTEDFAEGARAFAEDDYEPEFTGK